MTGSILFPSLPLFSSPRFLFSFPSYNKGESFVTVGSDSMGRAVKPAAWPPQLGRFQPRPRESTYLFPESIDLP